MDSPEIGVQASKGIGTAGLKTAWPLRHYLIGLLLGVTLIPLVGAIGISLWQYHQDIDRIERASLKQEMGAARLAERYLAYALQNTQRALGSVAKLAARD